MTVANTAAVVGFEGDLGTDFHVTWGTAAVRVGDQLVNPTTGLKTSIDQLDRLAHEGALFRFQREIPIAEAEATNHLILVAVRQESPHARILSVEKGRHGGIVQRTSRDKVTIYVVRDRDAFAGFTKDAVHRIIRTVFDTVDGADHADLVRAGLVLDPAHPYLNALRVYLTKDQPAHAARLARACVRGHKGQAAFEEILNALNSGSKTHILEYEKGVASRGGLDVGYAVRILNAIKTVVERLRKEVRQDYPFLPTQVPPPHLLKLEPGSARLHFTSGTDPEKPSEQAPIGERVARYLELRALEKALQGDVPPELLNPAFDEALERIVQPSPETSLRQKPFEKADAEPVFVDNTLPAGDLREDHVTLLGVITGILTDVQKVEIRIFPGPGGRLLVSTTDNGSGGEPVGLEQIETSSAPIHRLAVINLLRRSDLQGHQKFYLEGLWLVRPGQERHVLTIPSSLVRGAFRLIEPRQVAIQSDSFVFGRESLPQFRPIKSRIYEWLRAYQEVAERIEVSDAREAWYPAPRPRASSLARVVVSLEALGGKTFANEIAEEISRRFDTIVRINNTRREVRAHPRILEFLDEREKVVKLTAYGRQWAEAYRKAGGDAGVDSDADADTDHISRPS
jgi:hypothetical protein